MNINDDCIEEQYGRKIVCRHFFRPEEIHPGEQWQGSGGSIVTVEKIDGEWIEYSWTEKGEKKKHTKLIFAFQCRYCKIVGEE